MSDFFRMSRQIRDWRLRTPEAGEKTCGIGKRAVTRQEQNCDKASPQASAAPEASQVAQDVTPAIACRDV